MTLLPTITVLVSFTYFRPGSLVYKFLITVTLSKASVGSSFEDILRNIKDAVIQSEEETHLKDFSVISALLIGSYIMPLINPRISCL